MVVQIISFTSQTPPQCGHFFSFCSAFVKKPTVTYVQVKYLGQPSGGTDEDRFSAGQRKWNQVE